ncbi:nuclear transport factor 2 family protein [Pseudomonas mucidolens]|uniref:nuclear transport factor 2 family protein n=1 Tax=Pseudomonas mucidolens TaxID=46679 RepID=UPI0030D87DB9
MFLSLFQNLRAATLAFVVGSGLLPAVASAEVEARNKHLVTEAFDRWAAGGSTFFSDMLAPDVIWTIKGSSPSAGTYRGVDRFIEHAVRPFVSRLSSPVKPLNKQVWADGDHVIIQWDGLGVAQDGQPYHNSYAWIFHMRDGKAFEVTAFLDLAPYDDVLRRIPAAATQ